MSQVLRGLPQKSDPNLLVGSATSDDAGVYRLDAERALVQTVDFFTPIVDDPFLFGQIAAANSLSDVYAMGGRPVTAMNIVGMPTEHLDAAAIHTILLGGAEKVAEAGCVLIGGHSIENPEPVYGLSVTGLVHPDRYLSNDRGAPGDVLVLTKPLGTGIVSTAIKRDLATEDLAAASVRVMTQLNTAGALVAERGWVRAATDITGFGLLGHLASLCRESGVGADLRAGDLPVIGEEVLRLIRDRCVPGGTRRNLERAGSMVDWGEVAEEWRVLAADAQTSGGMLLCVPPARLEDVLQLLRAEGTPVQSVIGVLRPVDAGEPLIRVRP